MRGGGAYAAAAIAAIVLIATLGEAGASALGGTILHAAVAIAVASALALGIEDGAEGLPAGPLAAFLAFGVWAALGFALAPNAFAAWLVIVEIATFAGVAWLASRCSALLLESLPAVLAAGAAAHGIYSLVQHFARHVDRPPSTFLNVNHLAAWLVAAGLVAGSRAAASRAGRKWIAGALVPAACALALSGSRGAALGLVAGAAVLLALSWHGLERRVRRVVLAVAAAVALAAGVGIASRFRTPDPFPYQRAGIAKAAAGLSIERPWTGSGPGQFAVAAANMNFPVASEPLRFARVFATPHSDWLRAPAEFGWPAAAALALAIVLAASRVAARKREGGLTGAAAGAAAALIALATQALVDDLTSRPGLFVLAAALIGALLAVRPAVPAPRWPLPSRMAAAGLVALAFLVGDLAPYLALWEGEPRLNPLSPALWARRAERIATETGAAGFDLATYVRAREAAEHAVRLDRSDARWVLTLAQVEGLGVRAIFRDVAGRERVARLYSRAEGLARTNALIPLDAALFLRGAGDLDGARRAAERCLRLEPRAVAPRLVLAAILLERAAAGAKAQALALVDEAESLSARFSPSPKAPVYERRLLALDPRDAAVLRERAASMAAP